MLEDILQEKFGHKAFRGQQKKAIENILRNRNTLVIMATGSGKSLCYQLPAIVKEGMAIVISPLIALMKNQVDALNAKGIKAACYNSSIPKKVLSLIKEEVKEGKLKLLYVAPETLNKEETIELLQNVNISLIAVDEAHCISDWGHDFRPEYRNTRKAIEALGYPPIIALTATATPKVEYDILKSLEIEDSLTIRSTFHRPNLYYEVLPKQQTERKIVSFIKNHPGESGIIYCHSRKKTEELVEILKLNDINAASYHAGFDTKKRIHNQDQFLASKVDVIVATIAFGMGIDKPDVRFIIHYDIPKSLEGYYQETGRAGRDGEKSYCVLFFDEQDVIKLQKLNRHKTATEREINNRLLNELSTFSHSAVCRTRQLLYYFGEEKKEICHHCDNCQEERVTYLAQDEVTLLLETILATKERYDQVSMIKILTGIKEEHLNYDEKEMPNFGKGANHTQKKWNSIFKQLLIDGYLVIENPEIEIAHLTKKGKDFLTKPYPIKLLEDLSFELSDSEKAKKKGSKGTYDLGLFGKLVNLRDQIAIKNNIKPYLIFQEKALKALATYFPTTIEQLAQRTNVRISQVHKFGQAFIDVIKTHIEENNIEPPTHVVVKANTAKSTKKIHLIQQIDRKVDLREIARQNSMTYGALIKELEEISSGGIKLNLSYYIDTILEKELQDDLYEYFQEMKDDNIEQALEDLEDEFSEEEIRLMHIKFLSIASY
ncbi:MAG: ATP-dependent DNA helicase RecQ [Bacteroidota bacterium]